MSFDSNPADEAAAWREAARDRFSLRLGRDIDDDELQSLLEMEYDAECAAEQEHADAERERRMEDR